MRQKIYQMGEYLQMVDGAFRRVVPTVRDGQEYPLNSLNPVVSEDMTEVSCELWEHIRETFQLSAREGDFSESSKRLIADLYQSFVEEIEGKFSELENRLKDEINAVTHKACETYRADVLNVNITGFSEGKIDGTIYAARSLLKNREDVDKLRTSCPVATVENDVIDPNYPNQ